MRSRPADIQKCLRSRHHLLRHLRRPRRKSELVTEVEESRSTIDRALRELERAGFVARTDSRYRTTLAGELALSEYERFAARLDGIGEFRDTLADLPTDEPLDGALFEDAEVSVPTQCSPHEPVEALAAVLEETDHARVVGSVVIPRYVDIYYERIVEAEMTAEFVLARPVVEWLLARRKAKFEAIAETDGAAVAETTVELSFSLMLLDREGTDSERHRTPGDSRCESVGAIFYDEGTFLGFVHNDTRQAVEWGESLFDRIAADAESLHVSAGS